MSFNKLYWIGVSYDDRLFILHQWNGNVAYEPIYDIQSVSD